MSKGILISRSTKIKLGKKCFTHPSMANTNFFLNYRNMYNVVIRLAKNFTMRENLTLSRPEKKLSQNLMKFSPLASVYIKRLYANFF